MRPSRLFPWPPLPSRVVSEALSALPMEEGWISLPPAVPEAMALETRSRHREKFILSLSSMMCTSLVWTSGKVRLSLTSAL